MGNQAAQQLGQQLSRRADEQTSRRADEQTGSRAAEQPGSQAASRAAGKPSSRAAGSRAAEQPEESASSGSQAARGGWDGQPSTHKGSWAFEMPKPWGQCTEWPTQKLACLAAICFTPFFRNAWPKAAGLKTQAEGCFRLIFASQHSRPPPQASIQPMPVTQPEPHR